QAGWHASNALAKPANVTLVPLPAYSPELKPVERVWLYLNQRFLSHRLLADYDAIVDAACNAWNRLLADAGRIKSLCSYHSNAHGSAARSLRSLHKSRLSRPEPRRSRDSRPKAKFHQKMAQKARIRDETMTAYS
ncbi:MAG TPA: transposase, partial [Geobacterales bacterium]|nr:transposase [Geobacterales bacterium]